MAGSETVKLSEADKAIYRASGMIEAAGAVAQMAIKKCQRGASGQVIAALNEAEDVLRDLAYATRHTATPAGRRSLGEG